MTRRNPCTFLPDIVFVSWNDNVVSGDMGSPHVDAVGTSRSSCHAMANKEDATKEKRQKILQKRMLLGVVLRCYRAATNNNIPRHLISVDGGRAEQKASLAAKQQERREPLTTTITNRRSRGPKHVAGREL